MATILCETSNRTLALPNGPAMDAGGEGRIYRLSPLECVKIFNDPLHEDDIEKIHFLSTIARKLSGFAWPIELVRMTRHSESCGYVMQMVPGSTLESIIDNDTIPLKDGIAICKQIAAFVKSVHEFNIGQIVLGDVLKAGNLMVYGSEATFIDCASCSLTSFRKRNGSVGSSINKFVTPGYTAPEKIGIVGQIPSVNHDLFALAVLFFEILFGVPPYKPKPSPATIGFDPDDYVSRGHFFRFVKVQGIDPPTYPPIALPQEIENLFRNAFFAANRPSAEEWLDTFTAWDSGVPVPRKTYLPSPTPHTSPYPVPVHRKKSPLRLRSASVKILRKAVRSFVKGCVVLPYYIQRFCELNRFLVRSYYQTVCYAIAYVAITYLGLLGFRFFSADLDWIPISTPSSSRMVSNILDHIFGPDGLIPPRRSRRPENAAYSFDSHRLPSKDVGNPIMDQVLK